MTYLSEDPWPLVVVLGIAALGCLIALKARQEGKFLLWGAGCIALALIVLGIEALWVTDNERIETVVTSLADAVRRGDGDAAVALMAPELALEQGGVTLLTGKLARSLVGGAIKNARFDFLTVSRLVANAGAQSRSGTAEFRVLAGGSTPHGGTTFNFMTDPSGTEWSLGFREEAQGAWIITRITAVRLPRGLSLGGLVRSMGQ